MNKRLIAEAYANGPILDESVQRSWWLLAYESLNMARRLQRIYQIEYTTDAEPYQTAEAMFRDLELGIFRVSIANCEHPLWTPGENIAFRIVHDILGHYAGGRNPFIWRGELAAYAASLPHYTPECQTALFTEIVGQTAYRSIFGVFPPQKCIKLAPEYPYRV